MGKQKYFTEEERLAARRAANLRSYYKHREERLAQNAEWKKKKKENTTEEQKQSNRERERLRYQNDEEYRARRLASSRLWKDKHKNDDAYKEKRRKDNKRFYNNNKAKMKSDAAKYRSTQFGRATSLLHSYKQKDELRNRGECTLTAEWIIEHIFSRPCHYCGKTDWKELGCDRIDNELPHVPENVVPCCWDCNNKRGTTPYDEFMRLIKKVG